MNKPTPATESSSNYVWAFPGSPVRIHLSLAVVSKLREQLFTGFDPSSAKEIGGLLLGNTHVGRVHISDVRFFRPEEDGRNFVLSTFDKEELQKIIQQQHEDENLPAVVGYFRSDLRGGVRLSQEDLALSKELFNDSHQVFLIIHAKDSSTPTAGFFFWDNGSIFAEASFMQFPLDEKLLSIPRAQFPPSEPSQPLAEPDRKLPEAATPAELPPRFPWIPALLALVIALAGVLAYRFFKPETHREAAVTTRPVLSSPMFLSATRADQNVIVTWDANLPAISGARIGILMIKDGNSQTELPLTKAQLQIGKMIYVTQAARLELTLEVFSPEGKSTRESIMLAFTEPTKSRSRVDPVAVQSAPQTMSTREALPTRAVETAAPSAPVRTFVPATNKTNVKVPEQNVIIADTPPTAHVAAFDPSAMKAPDFLAPSPVRQVAPLSSERQGEAVRISRPIAVQPPIPIRQVKPAVPDNVSAMLKRRVDVQVRVAIDQTGKVIMAQPLVPPGGLNQYLGTSAASAARLWTFQPARRGDAPVVSELILNFTFEPTIK